MGCHLWGRTESDTTEVTQQQQQHGTLVTDPRNMSAHSDLDYRKASVRVYLGQRSKRRKGQNPEA